MGQTAYLSPFFDPPASYPYATGAEPNHIPLILCRNAACYGLGVAIWRGKLPLASKPCKGAKTNGR
jgi:hypothetical protein